MEYVSIGEKIINYYGEKSMKMGLDSMASTSIFSPWIQQTMFCKGLPMNRFKEKLPSCQIMEKNVL